MAYTTVDEVAAELGGVSLTASSVPTSTQVESWITESDAEINEVTNRVWESTTVTSSSYEYHDYNGTGRIILENAPIISIDSLEYESEGLGASSTAWSTLDEGRTSAENFIVYKEEGLINLHSTANGKNPTVGKKNIRVTYTHGYATTPLTIKRLSTLLTAKRYIQSVSNNTATEGGGSVSVGTISVDDPNNYVHNQVKSINAEVTELYSKVIPSFNAWLYDNQLYD